MVLPIVMSGAVGQLWLSVTVDICSICGEAALSATFNARSTAVWSREDWVRVFGEPCGVKVGDTALSSICYG